MLYHKCEVYNGNNVLNMRIKIIKQLKIIMNSIIIKTKKYKSNKSIFILIPLCKEKLRICLNLIGNF